jgi:hypothetical protein
MKCILGCIKPVLTKPLPCIIHVIKVYVIYMCLFNLKEGKF